MSNSFKEYVFVCVSLSIVVRELSTHQIVVCVFFFPSIFFFMKTYFRY